MTPKQAQQLADVHRALLAEDHFNDLMAAAARIDNAVSVLVTEDHFNDLMAAAARIDGAAGRIDDIEAKIDQLLTLLPPPPTP